MNTEKIQSGKTRFAANNELVRLQRNRRDLMHLEQKLNSHTCEPCTPSLYEEIQSLRSRLEQLRNSNNDLINSVKQHKQTFDDVADVVKQQIHDFNELRKGVFDYSRIASSH